MNALALYLKCIRMTLLRHFQYRISLFLMVLGTFCGSFVEFIGILVLMTRFNSLVGWDLYEVAFLYGMINISFAISEGLGRGFDMFAIQVINAEFDRVLLRPRSAFLQVLSHDFTLIRAGRFFQGLGIMLWAAAHLAVAWNSAKILLLLFALAGGVLVFGALLVMQAALCFWSTQSLEIVNSFTYGGVETTQWPLPVYNHWFAKIFILVIPLACVNYFPALAILNKPDALGSPIWFQWISPLAAVFFFSLALLVWRTGVRHYRSTGS
jgi:ABC-2 type transport system permease protein